MLIFHDFQPLIKLGLMLYPGLDAGEAQIFEQLGIIVLCLDFFCPFFLVDDCKVATPPPPNKNKLEYHKWNILVGPNFCDPLEGTIFVSHRCIYKIQNPYH